LDSEDVKFDSHDNSDSLIEIDRNSSDIKISVDPSNKMGTTIYPDVTKKLGLQDIADLMNKIQLQEELGASNQGDMILVENAYIDLVKRIFAEAQKRKSSKIQALSFLAGEDLSNCSYLSTVIYDRIEKNLRLFEGLKTPENGRKPRGTTGKKKRADGTP